MQKIKKIIIDNFKQNTKLYIIIKMLFSLAFSAMLLLDRKLVFGDYNNANITEVYFKTIDVKDIIFFIGMIVITYIAISIIEIIINLIGKKIWKKDIPENNEETKYKKAKGIGIYCLILVLIIITWLPYILSAFPGGIYTDTATSILEATGIERLYNHHPILYTLLIKGAIQIAGGNVQIGMSIFTVFQVITMAAVYAYLVYWLYKKNVSKIYVILTMMFFMFFNLIPLYAMSNWKDSLFSAAALAYMIGLMEIIYQDAENLTKIRNIITYVILIFFVSFLRNTGLYIVTAATICILIVYRKNIKDKLKKFTIISSIAILLFYIIQGPIYKALNLQGEKSESLGIPLQQIFYVVNKDGKLTEEQKELINEICPIEIATAGFFTPYTIDNIKWNKSYNEQFVEENMGSILKVWLEILIQNPKLYVAEYLFNTLGFWDINKAITSQHINYINYLNYGNTQPFYGITQTDYIKKMTGVSIQNRLATIDIYISAAVWAWIIMLSMILVIKNKKYKNLIILLPAFFVWGTLMIATPIAFTLRYAFVLILAFPLTIIVPTMPQKKE